MNRPHECQHAHAAASAPLTHASACGKNTASSGGHPAEPPRADLPAGTIYTCPMHPEVRQIGPGHCPKCGMALEPLMPTSVEDDSEIRSVRRRVWTALTLAVPVMLVAMVPHLFGKAHDPTAAWTLRILELALSAPVVLWAAVPYYRRGWARGGCPPPRQHPPHWSP